jgi:UPF0716 family protein affecting phage T7 exclusion
MSTSEEQLRFRQFQAAFGKPPQTVLGRVLTFTAGTALLVLALMFSLVAFSVIAIGGAIAGTWLWWKTRDVRKQMQEQMQQQANQRPATGYIIEGEVIREDEPARQAGKRLD